jgi:hypothetical protein
MRVIFSLLILVSVGSKAQVVWVTDTAENGARTRYEKHFKTLSQIHGDSADIRINGIYYLKVAKSVFLPQGSVSWDAITGKPVTFTPSAHVHAQSDVTNLTTSLAGKANTSHTHVTADITGYSAPSVVSLSADVTNNNAVANSIASVTNLSFNVTANTTYKFKFFIVYTSAATTTGSRWSITGPAITFLNYNSEYSLTATSKTFNTGLSAYDLPAASNATSASTGSNIAIIEGIIRPSANGTVTARFASEVASSSIVAKGGRSYVEYSIIN